MNVISDKKLEGLLAQLPAESVTKECIEGRIEKTQFHRVTDTLTHCTIFLDNGFTVSGESACVNSDNYNQEIGEKIAYDNAYRKLWPLFGFLLAEKNHINVWGE